MDDPNRNDKGQFVNGNNANPKGRPKSILSDKLNKAIEEVEQVEGKSLFKHFIERAYKSDSVLAVVFKKILPDKKAIEADILDERAQQLQENRDREQAIIDDAIKLGQALENAPDAMAGIDDAPFSAPKTSGEYDKEPFVDRVTPDKADVEDKPDIDED